MIEALGLPRGKLGLSGGFRNALGAIGVTPGDLGLAVIGTFIAAWALSYAIYKARTPNGVKVRAARRS